MTKLGSNPLRENRRYGWPKRAAQDDELVRRLTELNRQIGTGERPYHPFAYLDDG